MFSGLANYIFGTPEDEANTPALDTNTDPPMIEMKEVGDFDLKVVQNKDRLVVDKTAGSPSPNEIGVEQQERDAPKDAPTDGHMGSEGPVQTSRRTAYVRQPSYRLRTRAAKPPRFLADTDRSMPAAKQTYEMLDVLRNNHQRGNKVIHFESGCTKLQCRDYVLRPIGKLV